MLNKPHLILCNLTATTLKMAFPLGVPLNFFGLCSCSHDYAVPTNIISPLLLKMLLSVSSRSSYHSVLGSRHGHLRLPTILLSFHWLFPLFLLPAFHLFGPKALAPLCKMSAHLSAQWFHPSLAQVFKNLCWSSCRQLHRLSEPKTNFRVISYQVVSCRLPHSTLMIATRVFFCFVFNSKKLTSGTLLCQVFNMNTKSWQSTASQIIFCIAQFPDDSGMQ